MDVEQPSKALSYAFKVDPLSPYFIKEELAIFDIGDADVNVAPNSVVDVELIYSSAERTAAQHFASKMSIDGLYGAFSGAASMGVESSGKQEVKTVRVDKLVRAAKYTTTASPALKLSPHEKLIPSVAEFFKKSSVEDIEQKVGVFFATSGTLGGLFQKTYVMESMEDDNERKVLAELSGTYGAGLVNGSASSEYTSRSSNKNAKMITKWHCEGGDTSKWLSVSEENFQQVQTDWAASIDDSNLFVYGLTLHPIWEVVAAVDEAKGKALQAHLQEKWATMAGAFNPTRFLGGGGVPTGKVVIHNPVHNEYLYCGGPKLNNQRRHVLSWVGGERPPTDPAGGEFWKLEKADDGHGDDVYTIRSAWSNELLYCGRPTLDAERRHVLTWIGGSPPPTDPAGGEFWSIEKIQDTKYTIKNVIQKEFLYEGVCKLNAERRHCLTWIGGGIPPTTPHGGHQWTIEAA